jgi:hypothetical protein
MPWTVFQKSMPSGLATIVAGPSGPVAAQSSVCGHGTCRGQHSRSPGQVAWPQLPWTVFQKSRPCGLATIAVTAAQSSVCGHGTCRGQHSRSPCHVAWPQLWLALQGRPLRSPLFVATALAVDSVPEVQAKWPGHSCPEQCSSSPCQVAWPQLWLALQGRPLRSRLFVATALAVDSVPEVQAKWPGHNCRGQYSRSPGQVAWPQLPWTAFQKSMPCGMATIAVDGVPEVHAMWHGHLIAAGSLCRAR